MSNSGFQFGNKTYDRLKFVVQIALPALATFYAALGVIWGFPNIEAVVGTCTALALFLGTLLGVSSKNYEPEGPATIEPVGAFGVTEKADGTPQVTFALDRDPNDFVDGELIAFRKVTPSANDELGS